MSRNGHNNICNNKQGKIANTLCYCSKWCCTCCIPWHKTNLMNALNLKDYEPIRTAPWSWIYMTNYVQWNWGIGIIRSGVTIVLRWATCEVAKKTWKNSGLEGDWNHGALYYTCELSSHLIHFRYTFFGICFLMASKMHQLSNPSI